MLGGLLVFFINRSMLIKLVQQYSYYGLTGTLDIKDIDSGYGLRILSKLVHPVCLV